jgi:hypothetical protein
MSACTSRWLSHKVSLSINPSSTLLSIKAYTRLYCACSTSVVGIFPITMRYTPFFSSSKYSGANSKSGISYTVSLSKYLRYPSILAPSLLWRNFRCIRIISYPLLICQAPVYPFLTLNMNDLTNT